jgi:hypothetical protein
VEEDFSGEIEVFGENLLQNHFDHHISHMSWPEIEASRCGEKLMDDLLSYGRVLSYGVNIVH